jgi:hypothetical protein
MCASEKLAIFSEVEAGLKSAAYMCICEHFYFRPNEEPVLSLTKGSGKIANF